MRPIPIPDDDAATRTINTFDRISPLDGHKVGVVYIGEGQTKEQEILANVAGSNDYMAFLEGLGTLTRLKGATFNTQGLDREYDSDGQFTYCWRDRVTEIVFHVTTQMPTNLDHDPQCSYKKRHTGNDFVNIIFNDSGLPFHFDTFPSAFNYVNIVVTPESRVSFVSARERTAEEAAKTFYKVQVMSKQGFPEISPAAETKVVSLKALPAFVRMLALNASVFSLVWYNREGGEYISSWRSRLREIIRLREKHTPVPAAMAPAPTPGSGVTGQLLGSRDSASSPIGTMRDSFINLRRASAATFLTNDSGYRTSILSSATTAADPDSVTTVSDDSIVDGWVIPADRIIVCLC
jgi:hypothetical protein